ncbi:MAG: ABC transporter ATP-binding protein [Anaerolineae bacterium]|jgi:ABC-2 type transport system ATP-binding protein|nr:ABC transporter ATP-binding protein [Anaerolineae bacterium]
MSLMIETRDLVQRFGAFTAVNGLSLNVPAGAIFGFLGPNGAGKTTTMRMLTTLDRPKAGEAFVAGRSVTKDPVGVRRVIGYMPDEFGVYGDLRVWEYLDFFALCYDIADGDRRKLIDELLELVDLKGKREELVDKLSRGMKQRLSLARTLVHDPQVLILDEPASGLDPAARIEIRELMVTLAKEMGKTIFFSTHILADVESICTHIGIVEAGKLVMQGSMSELKASMTSHRDIVVSVPDEAAAELARRTLSGIAGVVAVQAIEPKLGRTRLQVQYQGDDRGVGGLNRALVEADVLVLGFAEEVQTLEMLFMQVTRGGVS